MGYEMLPGFFVFISTLIEFTLHLYIAILPSEN